MKELYLEVFSNIYDDGTCFVSLETIISLFTFIYCDYPPVLLTFVRSSKQEKQACFKIRMTKLLFEIIDKNELDEIVKLCKLPVLVTCDGTTAVAGLCAVLRHIIKSVDQKHPLLGFKQSCLYACAESSLWTKFCEVDIIEAANLLYTMKYSIFDKVEIPHDLARFEIHMSKPVRMHNIQKQKQNLAKFKSYNKSIKHLDKEKDLLEIQHIFAEGSAMTLADVMLFPIFHIIFKNFGSALLKQYLPLSYAWYENLSNDMYIKQALKLFLEIEKKFENEIYINYILPNVISQSLHKGDIGKRQPKRRFFTRQEKIVRCLEAVEEIETFIKVDPYTFGHEVDFDSTIIQMGISLEDTQVPPKRLERKNQQIQNMTKAVLKIAKCGDKIVDFCSGSGHLGLILAHALPRCNVILLENKEQSLNRAREQATKLKLSNIVFCQSNIDYFQGRFNVGISLHACGVATDLVMERCIQEKAAFVCCPCCYGSIQPNHMISYPRSQIFRNSTLVQGDYFVLGHSSDQTHYYDNVKTKQGDKCMVIIDSDRCLRAKEAGYSVVLSKLHPPSCTPKNNLLVGIPPLPN